MSRQSSNQRVFDEALAHIRRQGCQSYDAVEQTCLYRMPDGKMCAFGPAIRDYREGMEGNAASALLQNDDSNGCLHEWARDCNVRLADDIHAVHDNVADGPDFLAHFEREMRRVAEEYGLDYREAE